MHSVGVDNYYAPEVPPALLSVAVQREQRDSAEPQVSLCRPGGEKLSQKAMAEPRPPNEPHTANVASMTAPPPGLRMVPMGRESEKVANVQVALKSIQHARPAQASDTGYGTGLSSRKKVAMGMYVCLPAMSPWMV